MLSKTIIEDEWAKKETISLESMAMLTNAVDSWTTGTVIGSASLFSGEYNSGLVSKAGGDAVNNYAQLKTTFAILPSRYKKVRVITVFDTVNCVFGEVADSTAELDMGLFTSDDTSFVQLLFHGYRVRSKIGGVQMSDHSLMKTTDPNKRKTIEIVWNTVEDHIDVFENHVFIYRFQGAELPSKALSYQFKQKILTKNTTNSKFVYNRKLRIELEV